MADGPPDLQPASPKGPHAGRGSASLWNRGLSGLESGVGNASRVEQTEIARVYTTGRHPEGQRDCEPAGKQIDDVRLHCYPSGGHLQSPLPWQDLESERGLPSGLQCTQWGTGTLMGEAGGRGGLCPVRSCKY